MNTHQKRLEILSKIDEVSKQCNGCEHIERGSSRYTTNKVCTTVCPIGAEIKSLGDELCNLKNRQALILKKGVWMTKSEVQYLVDSGVFKKDIQLAMGVSLDNFYEIMRAWGIFEPKKKKVTA